MSEETITLECSGCWERCVRPRREPLLGLVHGNGWTYKCEKCNSEMHIVEDLDERVK